MVMTNIGELCKAIEKDIDPGSSLRLLSSCIQLFALLQVENLISKQLKIIHLTAGVGGLFANAHQLLVEVGGRS